MEKKNLIMLILAFCFNLNLFASFDDGPIPLSIVPPPIGHGGPQRSQPSVFYAFYEDECKLQFDSFLEGCLVSLLDVDESNVLSDYIDESGVIYLPNIIPGIYTIQLYVDYVIYEGFLII